MNPTVHFLFLPVNNKFIIFMEQFFFWLCLYEMDVFKIGAVGRVFHGRLCRRRNTQSQGRFFTSIELTHLTFFRSSRKHFDDDQQQRLLFFSWLLYSHIIFVFCFFFPSHIVAIQIQIKQCGYVVYITFSFCWDAKDGQCCA